MKKACTICKKLLPLTNFWSQTHANGRTYHHSYCKKCHMERRRVWHFTENGQKAHRRNELRQKYGITPETYEAMLAAQDGVCAICYGLETCPNRAGNVRQLAVDHDHATGAIRALLCHACNQGIGRFKDDPKLLRAAAFYVESHKAQPQLG